MSTIFHNIPQSQDFRLLDLDSAGIDASRMETQIPHKSFHNITASDNAFLHLGDIIYVSNESTVAGERAILNKIVDALIDRNEENRVGENIRDSVLKQIARELSHDGQAPEHPRRVSTGRLSVIKHTIESTESLG